MVKIRRPHQLGAGFALIAGVGVVFGIEAGLDPDVTPHIWRHSVATWLMQSGAEPFKAAGFLGMSVETLLRNYGHHHPDHSADVHSAMRRKAA